MLSRITLNCQVTIRHFPYSKCLGGSKGQGPTGLPVGSCPTGVFNFGTDRNRVLEKTLVSGIGNLFLINRVLSGIETPKDINRHFQTLHNKSWTLPRHPSDTPKHLLYGKCLTRHHRTLTRSMAPRVKVQATASRGPMWRRKSKPLGTKILSLGHLRPKSAIPHPITIQNMKFER